MGVVIVTASRLNSAGSGRRWGALTSSRISVRISNTPRVALVMIALCLSAAACAPDEQQRFLRQERVSEFDAFNYTLRLRGARLLGEAEIRSGFSCPSNSLSTRGTQVTVLRIEATSPTVYTC